MSLIAKADIKSLIADCEGNCVSIYMPTHRVGDEIQQDPIRLRNLLDQAEEKLISLGLRSPKARAILEPARDLEEQNRFWQHQSDGLALFLADEYLRAFRLPVRFEPLVTVSERFHTKPLMSLISENGQFFLLALSQNEVRLLQGAQDSIAQLDLPEEVPESLAEALMWDDPEAQLQWHTSTQNQVGSRPAVFHGQGFASEDDPKEQIARYFEKIDDGLKQLLADARAPLVLAGVDYLLPIYSQVTKYEHLVEGGIEGNPEELSAEKLHERAWQLVQPRFEGDKQRARSRYAQLAGQDDQRASTDLREIAPASYFEKTDLIFVRRGFRQWGSFDPESNAVELHEDWQPGDYDLADFSCAHTFLNGGAVYVLEAQVMPTDEAVAALFRY